MRAVHRASDYTELLFVESMRSNSLVDFTLHSGKAYVGWILNASVPDPERKFVEMLPLTSGFRAKGNPGLPDRVTNMGPENAPDAVTYSTVTPSATGGRGSPAVADASGPP